MTAPLDIGLEQHDASLHHGQEDVFDLDHTTRQLQKNGGVARFVNADEDAASSDEEDDIVEDDEVLDSEEERERKVAGLETELDGLYDMYQERMRERDSKYKVQEARRDNKEREEWHGIQEKNESDDESGDEGGWDKMQTIKAKDGEESDSDSYCDDSDDETGIPAQPSNKRRRTQETDSVKPRKKVRVVEPSGDTQKDAKLSRAAQVWFSQDFFNGAGTDEIEDDEEEEEEEEEEEDSEDEASDVEMSAQEVSDKVSGVYTGISDFLFLGFF